MRAFVKVTGNWHASELTCPMSHRQIGRYFYFPSTHSVGLRASSVRLRKRRFVNITTLMPYSRSWALPSWRVLMTLFIKCEKPILTQTCPRLKLKTQSKPLLCPSPRRTLKNFLLETQPLVTASQPKPRMFNKFNPLQMKPINLSILQSRRKILQSNSSCNFFFFFFFKLFGEKILSVVDSM